MVVFENLLSKDVRDLHVWDARNENIWQLTYNPLRALRPARSSSAVIDTIDIGFDHDQFNFNKPFLEPEILWQGAWRGAGWSDVYGLLTVSNAETFDTFAAAEIIEGLGRFRL